MGQNNSYAKNWFSIYTYPKKKNQYLLKKKNMIYYLIAFNLCLDVSRKREKGKKKKKRQGNKQVQIKLKIGRAHV